MTTEGGLDAAGGGKALAEAVAALAEAGCRVSLFVDPDPAQLDAAVAAGAPVVELHTGSYCDAQGAAQARELDRLRRGGAARGRRSGSNAMPGMGWPTPTCGRWRRSGQSSS